MRREPVTDPADPIGAAGTIEVAGETFRLLPEGLLAWPRQAMVIAADVHLGKAETFAQNGLVLPPQAQHEDLARLLAVLRRESARHLVFLGDLVHTWRGITPALIQSFAEWLDEFGGAVTLIAGNHDRGIVQRWPAAWHRVRIVEHPHHLIIDGIAFVHDPGQELGHELGDSPEAGVRYTWAGHLHPCVRIGSRADQLRLKAFVVGGRTGILPAFSTLAGGADVVPSPGDQIYAIGGGQIIGLDQARNHDRTPGSTSPRRASRGR